MSTILRLPGAISRPDADYHGQLQKRHLTLRLTKSVELLSDACVSHINNMASCRILQDVLKPGTDTTNAADFATRCIIANRG